MIASTIRYVTDADGRRVEVIMSIHEYERLLAELEEAADVAAYDAAEAADEETIPLEDVLRKVEGERGQ